MRRYICIDFETNGFRSPAGAPRSDWTLPFSSYPTQLSVDVVEEGVVWHAFDTCIRGATSLAPWVRENVPVSMEDIRGGRKFEDVLEELANLIQEGDTLVAHNANFDINMVIVRAARLLAIKSPALDRILACPRFCTMRSAYARTIRGDGKWPSMAQLCEHFEVTLRCAHDARGDSEALANCVAEAWRRGVMLPDAQGSGEERGAA